MKRIMCGIIVSLISIICFVSVTWGCNPFQEAMGLCKHDTPAPDKPELPFTPPANDTGNSDNTTSPSADNHSTIYYVQAIYMDKNGVPKTTWIGFTKCGGVEK